MTAIIVLMKLLRHQPRGAHVAPWSTRAREPPAGSSDTTLMRALRRERVGGEGGRGKEEKRGSSSSGSKQIPPIKSPSPSATGALLGQSL